MLASYRNDLKPITDLAQSFAARELAGKTGEHDRYPFGEFYDHVLDKAHDVGFLGAILPESLGGIGGGIAALCEILLHVCEADASPGGIIFTQALSQKILLAAGAQDLAQSIFPGAASAKDLLVAFPAYTNPVQNRLTSPGAKKRAAITTSQGGLNFLFWATSRGRLLFRRAQALGRPIVFS